MVRGVVGLSSTAKEGAGDEENGLGSSSSGFLSTAQQEVLDRAIKEKQKSGELNLTKHASLDQPLSPGRSSVELKAKDKLYDRHSRSRSDKCHGKPKKQGAGGKFNWGSNLDVESSSGAQDPKDPNYDSADDTGLQAKVEATHIIVYKETAMDIIRELFLTGDLQEAALSLQELEQPQLGHLFVKKLVTISLDGSSRVRELASALLPAVTPSVLPQEQVQRGFLSLAQSVDDLSMDVPAAVEQVGTFLARAVSDEALAPEFLDHLASGGSQGEAGVRRKAEILLQGPHSAERLQRCWGAATSFTFQRVREGIDQLLKEYVLSCDAREAAECLHAFKLPLVHHELVKQALCMAVTEPEQAPRLLELLGYLSRTGDVSESQLIKGFTRVANGLEDLALDVPQAKPRFAALCETAEQRGWLPTAELRVDATAASPTPAAADHSLRAFKEALHACLKEYYCSGDTVEVGRCLKELNKPGFHSLVVKQAVQLAVEAKDREREMTACLIRSLCPGELSHDQVALGFTRLLACAEDMTLDSPDAAHQLALMLGRLVVDEVLPPAFLTAVLPSLKDQSLGVTIVGATGRLLSARHAAERLQLCWHCGNRSIEDIKTSIKDLVSEYVLSGDPAEAARCWRDLDVGFYGHQLVFMILVTAFEKPAKVDLLLQLIKRFEASGEVSQTQIQKGFSRVEMQLSDLKLDYPASPKQFASCKEAALQQGWISPCVQL